MNWRAFWLFIAFCLLNMWGYAMLFMKPWDVACGWFERLTHCAH